MLRSKRLLVGALVSCMGALSPGAGATAAPVGLEGVGPGYFASDNIEHVAHIPINLDSPGARKKGNFFYITTSNGLTIYDVSDPEAPQRTGFLPLPQQPYYAEEDVDTNGRILLISTLGTLYVIDVEDKTNPVVIGELPGGSQHTWSCILNCTWAYGSEGMIADLRDPASPKVAGNWGEGMPARGGHDVTEIRPGIVVTSTQPIMLLDARKAPGRPKLLATGANEDRRFIHSNLWPRGGKDRFLLVGGETTGPRCGETAGAFMTWDATKAGKTRTFTMIDEYRVKNGLPIDGDSPANLFCTHWFDTRPGFKNGGFVAMAWYEHGTRFFEITGKGKIEEAGYFMPWAGSTSAAYWITKDILYTADYNRGIDIIRFNGRPAS